MYRTLYKSTLFEKTKPIVRRLKTTDARLKERKLKKHPASYNFAVARKIENKPNLTAEFRIQESESRRKNAKRTQFGFCPNWCKFFENNIIRQIVGILPAKKQTQSLAPGFTRGHPWPFRPRLNKRR
jgi:hypothetical protein